MRTTVIELGRTKSNGFGVTETETTNTLEAVSSSNQAVAFRTAGDGAVYEEGDRTAPLTTQTDPSTNIVAYIPETGKTLTSGGSGARGQMDAVNTDLIAFTCKDHGADAGDLSPTLRSMGHNGSHANAGGQVAVVYGIDEEQNAHQGLMGCLKSREKGGGFEGAVAIEQQAAVVPEYYSHDYCQDQVYSESGVSPALNCTQEHKFRTSMAVRRLTPNECDTLQGFKRGYTLVPHRGKPAADGPRYKAVGNSMAIPVVRWLGERIQMVDDLIQKMDKGE